ncbi:MAG: polyprenyl synthetase family protein [Anaerolineales bacterium]|nr:MAG: polyprenyl synthetase family protein [Anaerolineales bacterium]
MEPSELLTQMRASIEAELKTSLQPLQEGSAAAIGEMVAYHLGWNFPGAEGKRIRPVFSLLCCGAVCGNWQSALPVASAVEWVHNFSLIHDDIQDQSATRRGRDTVWTRSGIAQAINTGDAIFTLARLATQRLNEVGISPASIIRIHNLLDQASLELTIGQHLDMDFEARGSVQVDEYMEMIAGKTGALLYAACAAGALVGGADEAKFALYGEFGRNVGLAFQMYDDLLGIWGDSKSTGKPAGDDIRSRKKTLPILYGIQNSGPARTRWEGSLSSEAQVGAMIQALEDTGARAHTLKQAEQFTQRALISLHQAQALQPYGDKLEKLSLRLLKRED